VLKRQQAVSSDMALPHLIFWGRLAPEKALDHALQVVAALRNYIPRVRFQIIGPDRGELPRLLQLVRRLSLEENVFFLGEKSHSEIKALAATSSLYLQTSLFEGMALSVMEAMQLGLVPLVTPVGEISNYCQNGYNALFLKRCDPQASAFEIAKLLADPQWFYELRRNAITTWETAPLYCDHFIYNCREVLECQVS
jgi:glycosyltransferase involved in cell wall biosynthesis